jgi:ABC-2 type transport system ATP-binding protein
MAAIETEKLEKGYSNFFNRRQDTLALKNLSFEVREGETFGFLGPNGAGKTTTILLLLNLIRPSSGSAHLLHDYYTGQGLLEFYAALLKVPREIRGARITELLKLLGLEDAAHKSVSKYSKGMLQRLGFAQAMLHDPDLLILDEPTASLDPVGRKEFRDILVELKRRGKTIFISSHILSEVESVCDRVAILQKGELKRIGTLQELSTARSTRLILKNVPGTVLEALAATSAEVTMLRGQITVKCGDAPTRTRIEELLQQHGIQPERTEVETQSLEDIFFSTIDPPPRI